MPKVAVLSDALINKIAAGEVVERPASVVKELVENALDAGSKSIRVALSGGGLKLVSVIDDGGGMSREDAVLAMTRHATSKLRDLEGLFSIQTMGFRGEALPAIASVSRFSLVTSEHGAEVGTRIEVAGGAGLTIEDAPPVGGTRIRVEDLFFATPARRKFMRAEQTELGHCEEAVIRIALARPDVAFQVEHEGKPLFTSAASAHDLRERIAAALGTDVHRHLVPVEERRLGVAVTGFLARPEYNLANARGVYTFVNRRYVRDRALNSAIQRAFGDTLPFGRHPVVVLFIELDPRDVDVNVHPQKMEVRFQDQRGVADAVSHALLRTLRETESATFAQTQLATSGDASQYAHAVERFLTRAAGGETLGAPVLLAQDSPFSRDDGQRAPAFGEARPGLNEAPPPGFFASLKFLAVLARRFWLCEGAGGTLAVIDPHAAWERALLERYRRATIAARHTERTLFSGTVELPAVEARLISGGLAALERVGVEVEPFGGTTFAIRAVPRGLEGADGKALLTELAAAVPSAKQELSPETLSPALRVLACHAAKLSPAELGAGARDALLRELDAVDFDVSCRHGRVVALDVPLLELERRSRGLE